MSWLEITFESFSEEDTQRFEEALEAAGALSITYQALDDNEEIFEPPIGSMPLWEKTGVTGLFAQDADLDSILLTLYSLLGENLPINKRLFADSEWTRAWLDYFKPILFAGKKRLWIAATEHVIDDADALVMRLDPGLAFGTGTHPSTALCLQFLANCDLHGKTVYDYGCGSGILGIAAAMLGAEKVFQTDIDPQALQASRENAAKNHVAEKIDVLAEPENAPQVDFIVANILLEPLCALRPQFEKHIKNGTTLIFAGLLARQEQRIRDVYSDFTVEKINENDGWIILQLKR